MPLLISTKSNYQRAAWYASGSFYYKKTRNQVRRMQIDWLFSFKGVATQSEAVM